MSKYISDEYIKNLQKMMKHRIKEADLCFTSGSYFATILLIGSCAECILYSVAIKYAKNNPRDWNFESLINWAFQNNIITDKSNCFLQEIKNLRNLIHIKLDFGQSNEIDFNKVGCVIKNFEIVTDEIFTSLKSLVEVANASN